MNNAPIFNWLKERGAGVLLHPTALPGNQGIGTLGQDARAFVDFVQGAGMNYWQICPLGPTGYGHSPYQCYSAFAGNANLIDLEELAGFELLRPEEIQPLRELPRHRVDYDRVAALKGPLLRLASRRFHDRNHPGLPGGLSYPAFKMKHASWLPTYAYYMALKEHYKDMPWQEWPEFVQTPSKAEEFSIKKELAEAIESAVFSQYVFFSQWKRLKAYANDRHVQIIGDMPIFVALDSADTWANPQLFQLKKDGSPKAVAGVPPDYFSSIGQLWGNPLYDWEALETTGYDWWLQRFALNFDLFDIVRLDHFRGFEAYWRIPAGAKDARHGQWMPGPGLKFFQAVKERFPQAKIIAEDLGLITPSLLEFTEATGLPGMGVLQFAFSLDPDNLYLPHNLKRNSVIYTGTHDNDTTLGWWRSQATPDVQDHVRRYLRVSGEEITYDFIRAAYRTVCRLAITPVQDLLAFGSEARFNTPGTVGGNWKWRCEAQQLQRLGGDTSLYLKEIAWLYKRYQKAR